MLGKDRIVHSGPVRYMEEQLPTDSLAVFVMFDTARRFCSWGGNLTGFFAEILTQAFPFPFKGNVAVPG